MFMHTPMQSWTSSLLLGKASQMGMFTLLNNDRVCVRQTAKRSAVGSVSTAYAWPSELHDVLFPLGCQKRYTDMQCCRRLRWQLSCMVLIHTLPPHARCTISLQLAQMYS